MVNKSGFTVNTMVLSSWLVKNNAISEYRARLWKESFNEKEAEIFQINKSESSYFEFFFFILFKQYFVSTFTLKAKKSAHRES